MDCAARGEAAASLSHVVSAAGAVPRELWQAELLPRGLQYTIA